ncbi:hypothetical protein [Actinomadura litoris]|uniref:hypothetical protein n=1 Tax=Actinomadura litoris TaxID=2678616 RepID=UPI001FA76CCD|nr:hypothetical protein [Actinomadura litoris]
MTHATTRRLAAALAAAPLLAVGPLAATPAQSAPAHAQPAPAAAPAAAAKSGTEAPSCSRVVTAAPGRWTEDRGCSWSTPRGGPTRIIFWWNIAPQGTNQTACVEAKAVPNGPWHSAGCGKAGNVGLPAPGNSIGAYQVRVRSTQPFTIAQVRWGRP